LYEDQDMQLIDRKIIPVLYMEIYTVDDKQYYNLSHHAASVPKA